MVLQNIERLKHNIRTNNNKPLEPSVIATEATTQTKETIYKKNKTNQTKPRPICEIAVGDDSYFSLQNADTQTEEVKVEEKEV